MKNTALASVAVLSLLALTSVACSPAVAEPKAPMQPDVETSTTSLTSAEAMPAAPLPANNAPLEGWYRGTPEGAATAPASATAPAKPGVQPLDGWSYP